ncbi:MAG: CsbD family protein [Terriglobales bacterium]
MNSDQVQGKWKQIKGGVKERWGKLTDDDVNIINGQRDQLVGRVQERYGIAKEQAQKQVDEWLNSDTQDAEYQKQKAS